MGDFRLQLSNGVSSEHFAFVGNRVEHSTSFTGYAARLGLMSCEPNGNCNGAYARFAIADGNLWAASAGYMTQTRLFSRFQGYAFAGLRMNSISSGPGLDPQLVLWPSAEFGAGLSLSLDRYVSLYAEGGLMATLPYGAFASGGLRLNL